MFINQDELKETLKELFRNGSIEIEHEVKETCVSLDLLTKVLIDGEKIYEDTVEIQEKE
ncbi:hypothetical protein [Peribacillus simplex]|uniref:hypothetical protein n=1 Tax=Peribacillus simplex TaxID=1478 RepID=UPI001627B099|nr:hypothetical protein [Peribacillus simplex]